MIPNILFKVISNDPINQSIVVKFCRENAQNQLMNIDHTIFHIEI